MPLELRIVKELLATCGNLANVESLSMSHLMLSVGAFKVRVGVLP